jgi:hypothetical protein
MASRLRALGPVAAVIVITATGLTACGGNDTPAVCADVQALKSSVAKVADVKLDQGALETLRTDLAAVQSDLTELKSSAASQYSGEVDAVDQDTASLRTKLQAAVDAPSAQTVSAVGAAVRALGTSLTALKDAVASTC